MVIFFIIFLGDIVKVKLFDCEHEGDLQSEINAFIENVEVIDIKYNVAVAMFGEEQIFCFSAMIIYKS